MAGQAWTYASLGEALGMRPSQVHRSVKRAVASGLALEKSRGALETVRTALHEFAVHGVRYAFPAVIGPPKRGIPTAFGVPALSTAIASAPGEVPVWPSAQGTARRALLAGKRSALRRYCRSWRQSSKRWLSVSLHRCSALSHCRLDQRQEVLLALIAEAVEVIGTQGIYRDAMAGQ
ncbi:hypothetical protein MUG10_04045 [Xanthomonas prunicola]|uniref:Uncharacterized protein n=1 Tax=Xanthomonas prunicola TaxID=2053930 RepID=A0A9Q9J3D2_9XANT|nr:hypothetical protein [Xanthomonas prunicola]USJ01395.1 hypothetical protein MUG10_04045 [Xanthomonas prunicola]UXA51067.1 hypothetical protein M0D44_05120 [Xanthomonas prunicola]UXA63510.1 hypothetical protein M0D48_15405 [Xanthomonas prunicola]UXA67504.1 hypothetical protein M0D43_05335 [Xanthomonas prunicola]